jgi:hypothetical protein
MPNSQRYLTNELIAALRATGRSQKDIANQLGICRFLLCKWVNGAPLVPTAADRRAVVSLCRFVKLTPTLADVAPAPWHLHPAPPKQRKARSQPEWSARPAAEHRHRDTASADIEASYARALAEIRARRSR